MEAQHFMVITSFCLTPGRDVYAGDVLAVGADVTRAEAEIHVRRGWLVECFPGAEMANPHGKAEGKTSTPDDNHDGDGAGEEHPDAGEITHRDPAPKKTPGKRRRKR